MAEDNKNTYATLSLVFGIISLLIFAMVFGPLAIILGSLGLKSEKKNLAIVGIVLGIAGIILWVVVMFWMIGILNSATGGGVHSGVAASFSGFSAVKPVEWTCESSTGEVTLTAVNGAGGQITEVSITGGACDPIEVSAGDTTTCTLSAADGCAGVQKNRRFETEIHIRYISPTGAERSSSGTLWGPAE